jgi:AcrR family transcriptional regulator
LCSCARERRKPDLDRAGAGVDDAALVSRREPVQRRSRERVELLLATAAEVLADGGVEALTTRSLSERTGIPVATIYRYFANRDEIIGAYLDHEMERIDAAFAAALMQLDRVTFRSFAQAGALAHMRHHQSHPEGVPVWFAGRQNPAVLERVRELDGRLAYAFRSAIRSSGMLEGAPDFAAELIVRLFDRMFEFVFREPRTAAEQETIVLAFVDMIASYLEQFSTPRGVEGIATADFARALTEGFATVELQPDTGENRT